jgi:hypothetical protein
MLAIEEDVAKRHRDLPGGPALFTVGGVGPDGAARQAEGQWPEPEGEEGADIALWPAPEVFGFRERRPLYDNGRQLVEQYLFSVSNQSAQPVTVWVEEELRTGAANRQVRKNWPTKARRRGDVLRFRITVKPKKIERLGFEAEYRW